MQSSSPERPKVRMSFENHRAVTVEADKNRRAITVQLDMILDGWRENLKSVSKLPTGKKARKAV